MPRKYHTPEQIINKLREAEVELSQGRIVAQVCRKIGVTEQTYYRWRKEYGGMKTVRLQTIWDTLLSELGYRIGFLSQVDGFASC